MTPASASRHTRSAAGGLVVQYIGTEAVHDLAAEHTAERRIDQALRSGAPFSPNIFQA